MARHTSTVVLLAICVASTLAWLSTPSAAISIEREQPVRVTNRNSGPRYELEDDVEKTKLTDSTPTTTTTTDNNQDDKRNAIKLPSASDDAPTPIGHMSIRRIFLVPMMSGPRPDGWQSVLAPETNEQQQQHDQSGGSDNSDQQQQPGLLTRPFWPFLTPPIRSPARHHQHLFGADESSRPLPPPPTATNDREREGDSMLTSGSANNNNNPDQLQPSGVRPMFDPIQMMLDMMHAALSGQLTPPEGPLHDLANEAASNSRPDVSGGGGAGDNDDADRPSPSLTDLITRPLKPTSNNETKEDVVEIDGKKFLRKVVINRHVGENIVFMTKRLIFTPLNETTNESGATTTTMAPVAGQNTETKTTNKPEVMSIDKVDKPSRDVPDGGDEPTTTTTTTSEQPSSTTTAPPPTTTTASDSNNNNNSKEELTTTLASSASSPTTTTTTSAQPEDSTTTKADSSWAERVSDAIERAAERIVDNAEAKLNAVTTTEKP